MAIDINIKDLTESQRKDLMLALRNKIKEVELLRYGDRKLEEYEDYWRPFFDESEKEKRMYFGDQWDPNLRRAIEEQGRPALDINLIFPTVNRLVGQEKANRVPPRYYPVGDDDDELSETFNMLYKYVEGRTNLKFLMSDWFLDGCVAREGYIWLDLHWDENYKREIKLTREDNHNVLKSPNSIENDMTDSPEVFRVRWMTSEKIVEMWPNKEAEIRSKLSLREDTFDQIWDKGNRVTLHPHHYEDRVRGVFKVVEMYKFLTKEKTELIDLVRGRTIPVDDIEDIQKFLEENKQVRPIKRKKKELWVFVWCKNIVLDYYKHPVQTGKYPAVRFFPYRIGDEVFGVVTNLVGPQEEVNKRRSQLIHSLNMQTNSPLFIEQNGFVDGPDLAERKMRAGGKVVEYKRGFTAPQYGRFPVLPNGFFEGENVSRGDIKEISGVGPAFQGFTEKSGESGKLFNAKILQGDIMAEVLFDNYRRAKHAFGKLLIPWMQKVYNREKIFRVINQATGSPQTFGINIQVSPEQIKNNITVADFDLIVDDGESSPTAKRFRFLQQLELSKFFSNHGVMPPIHLLIAASDFPDKDQWIQYAMITNPFVQQLRQQQLGPAGAATPGQPAPATPGGAVPGGAQPGQQLR